MELIAPVILSLMGLYLIFIKGLDAGEDFLIPVTIGTILWSVYEWWKVLNIDNEDSKLTFAIFQFLSNKIIAATFLFIIIFLGWLGITLFIDKSEVRTPTNNISKSFKGFPCTSDCSGHQAGYEWAEKNNIKNISDCGGNSDSFITGCQVWAQEASGKNEPREYDDRGRWGY